MRTFGFAGSPILDESENDNTDKQRSTQIQLYPNPNGGEHVVLNINGMEGETTITISDATGRVIEQLTKTIEGDYYQQEIMFQQSLSSGLYQITIDNRNHRESTRMVVVR
jgi:carbamoylphosphate synthase large subunit